MYVQSLLLCAWPLLLSPLSARAQCWSLAAERYNVAPELLYAIAKVESGLNPRAINRNPGGSYDIGLMQINSAHLPALARQGISEHDLYAPCTNLLVGARLLADLFTRYGRTWNAVGAYNAGCSRLRGDACVQARSRYANKVFLHLRPSHNATLRSVRVKP